VSGPVRAALVGAGAIAPFHVSALRAAGFEISHLAARPGSNRAESFARLHGIERVWSDPTDLIDSADWDALVIASATESVPQLLASAKRIGKPCLVEKPVDFDGTTIRELAVNTGHVRVAYNRRFYSTVAAARDFATTGSCVFRMELPESIQSADQPMRGLRAVHENSVHGFDLLASIVGRYRIERVDVIDEPRSRLAVVSTPAGHVGTIALNWNCPANFSLVLDRSPQRFELKPFELGSTYEGMEVIEPSEDMPVRRYVPRLIQQVSSFPGPDGIKPGFLEQARSLMSAVQGEGWDSRSATIDDAAFVADIARTLTSD